jgi:dihydroorotase-like cyclic amidohydrolase
MAELNKDELLDIALKNEFNELAGFLHLGSERTLELMAEAQAKGKTVTFDFDTDGGALDKITYKFI